MRVSLKSSQIVVALSLTFLAGGFAVADDMASFATGGYARGLRTMDEMHMIDTNGDGHITKDEWLAYQKRVFAALDRKGTGDIDEAEFLSPSSEMVTFATGGYARGLQTKAMMHKIDTDHDGKITLDEFLAYQTKVFDMLDEHHTDSVGPQEFLGR